MKLSVIIPAFNEVNHINDLVNSIINIDDTEKEILIVDGGSTDGTRDVVKSLSADFPNIRLVDNPERYVSNGFNRAFKEAHGEYIALVGAHAIYPANYFAECINAIDQGICDVSGGFLLQKGKTDKGKAIAKAMSSKFGVGDTAFRTNKKKLYVDSVAFAIYPRRIFESAGLFDEDLIRNQDDEFHYRLNQKGFRILMLPQMETIYYVRDSFQRLFSQYFQYGLYKPLVFQKVSSGIRLRHVIPSVFVLYIVTIPFGLLFPWYYIPLGLYILLCLYFGLKGSDDWTTKVFTIATFPVIHVAYGSGFLKGLFIWRRKK